jgi:hypothetical protein
MDEIVHPRVKIELGSGFYIGIVAIILAMASLYFSFPMTINGITCPLDIHSMREVHN